MWRCIDNVFITVVYLYSGLELNELVLDQAPLTPGQLNSMFGDSNEASPYITLDRGVAVGHVKEIACSVRESCREKVEEVPTLSLDHRPS